ncbi:error-prone DNA polymerase [Echinimonas agarilytica]|uniref:Error-prone DNA polymerase n=1 Tax=Echinimonas agarilytica TaxID=1215918 RepID=A0AA41W993_9GAMM|nr:error-prone DNA polymerase [Echinimonas agarilytica]MCM2681091.1 error-prone DNA polymerase [Echinimonas agarilytica]
MNSLPYAELFCRSNFSFLRAASHPEELVEQALELGYSALAITDECTLAGIVRAHVAAKAANIPLVVGSYFRLECGTCLVIWAPTRQAYAELSALITQARMRSPKGHYQMTRSDIKHHIQHCFVGWLPSDSKSTWDDTTQWLIECSGKRGRILVERPLSGLDKRHYLSVTRWAEQHDIEAIACGGVLMHCKQRQPLQDALTAIRLNQTIHSVTQHIEPNGERHLRPLTSLAKLFQRRHLEAAAELASQCQFSLDELKYEYPAELVPEGHSAMSYLRQLVDQGQRIRFPRGVPLDIQAIIAKELSLIGEMQYAYFFLTIYDIVRFARRQHILHQGRGSAANSVVCYCLQITEVDPRKINVLFERFISKERGEPPDIDVDFEHERREEVIQYIYQKYGRHRAALAATVISYRFKSAVKDVGKALGFDESLLEQFMAGIDRRDRQDNWRQQLVQLGPLDHPKVRWFETLVNQIMGFPRHLSQHVGGFVISAGPLSELVPTENAAMAERSVIQWDKDDLEALGLLKVDVLALGMLTAIRRCFDLIRDVRQEHATSADAPMTMANVQWEQPEVYDMLCNADSIGVFQIESRAQTNMLPRLRPRCYYDLVVQIAIVRPGPIQGDMVHPYLKRRHGLEPISYPNQAVRQVLERTMGVPIFQEQVIKLAMVAAGFSAGEADQLRRAMAAWKRNGKLAQFEHKLRHGMAQNGYSDDFADRIFRQILGFGEYGFPESHSASFALLAYVSAWLKLHYPAAFCCALLNSQPMGFYSPSQLIQDAQRHGVNVVPVDVNESCWEHRLVVCQNREPVLQLGLRIIKGLSKKAGMAIETKRPVNGYENVATLLQLTQLASDQRQALAAAGALNGLSGDRFQARWQLATPTNNLPLLEVSEAPQVSNYLKEPTEMDNMLEDYRHLGLSLERHPLAILREMGLFKKSISAQALSSKQSGELVTVVGLVVGRQRPSTASGVTFVTLEDETGNINVVVWLNTARAQRQAFLQSKLLEVHGILEREGLVIHIVAGRLENCNHQLEQLTLHSRDFH